MGAAPLLAPVLAEDDSVAEGPRVATTCDSLTGYERPLRALLI